MRPEILQHIIKKGNYQAIAITNATAECMHANICWNTGEEKNCHSRHLSKGCKART